MPEPNPPHSPTTLSSYEHDTYAVYTGQASLNHKSHSRALRQVGPQLSGRMRLLLSFSTVSHAPANSNMISHLCQFLGEYMMQRTDSSSLRILQSQAPWYITLAHGRKVNSREPQADVYASFAPDRMTDDSSRWPVGPMILTRTSHRDGLSYAYKVPDQLR